MDIYKDLDPHFIEINPMKKEIQKTLTRIERIKIDAKNLIDSQMITQKSLEELNARLQESIDSIRNELVKFANVAPQKSFLAGEDLADYFIAGQQKVRDKDGNIRKLYDIQPRDRANPRYMETINALKADAMISVNAVSDSMRDNLDRVVKAGMDQLRHPSLGGKRSIANEIKDRLINEGVKVVDRGGRLWDPTVYSKMYARTRSREYQTDGIEYRMNEVGMDLVKISEHVDVDGMDICNDYEGNVYSLSGKHEKYPALPEHTPFHPNCAHVETPWSEKYHEVDPEDRLGIEDPERPAPEELTKPKVKVAEYKDLETTKECTEWLQNSEYNITGSYGTIAPEVANAHNRAIVKFYSEFPELNEIPINLQKTNAKSYYGEFSTHWTGTKNYGAFDTPKLRFSGVHFKNSGSFWKQASHDLASDFHYRGFNMEGTLAHELTHALEFRNTLKRAGLKLTDDVPHGMYLSKIKERRSDFSRAIRKIAHDREGWTALADKGDFRERFELMKPLGKYAQTDSAEFLAETIADALTSENPQHISMIVLEEVRKAMGR